MGFEEILGDSLIHGDAGARKVRSGIGNPHQVKAGLYSAVLPVCPMQSQKHTVRAPADLQHSGAEKSLPPLRPQLLHGLQIGILLLHGVNLRYQVHSPLKNLLLIPLIAQIHIQQDNLMPAFLKRMINHHP